ncbi:hypothetical protein, partial [Catenulispora rubra]|uniref:hypothetical protein n=1 Tax=Catenulispora rubra TaxID=280293 RepID=UPI0018920333
MAVDRDRSTATQGAIVREDVKPVLTRRLATAAGAAVLIGACLGSAPAWAQTSQTFTQDGIFTVPDG